MGSRQNGDRAAAARRRHRHTPLAQDGRLASMSCERHCTLNEHLEKHALSGHSSPKVTQCAEQWNGVKLQDSVLRQHQIPIKRTTTASTSTSTTANDSWGPESDDNTKPWKIELAGKFLDSTSECGRNEVVISNATHLLRRLKLDLSKDSDKGSSRAEMVKSQTMPRNTSLSATYNRPVDSLAKHTTSTLPVRPLLTTNSAKPVASTSHVSGPSEFYVTVGTSSFRFSSTSYTPTSNSPRLHHFDRKNDLRKVSFMKSASESDYDSDDDSVKRMESVTHTFQRNLSVTNRNSKVSAIPLSGIGVDVGMSEYNKDDEQYHCVNTPCEAYASCSLTSFIGEIVGLSPVNESGSTSTRSPFDIIVSIPYTFVYATLRKEISSHPFHRHYLRTKRNVFCSPNRVPNACSEKDDRDIRKSAKDDVASVDADDWSQEHGVRSESDDDESMESCIQREADLGRSTKINIGEARSYRQPGLPQCSRYHREDLSYYGTEVGSSYYQASEYSRSDDETAADTRSYQPSQYSHVDDDRSDTVSPVSFQRSRRFRDSPFVRRWR